jgi:hypothetical protein
VIRRGRGAIVSTRGDAPPIAATRTDIFVSPFGGGAGDRCVLTHLANPLTQLKTNCYPLKEPVAQAHLNERDFVVDVPLPPHDGAGHAIWRFESRDTPGGVAPVVDVVPFESAPEPYLHVTVRMTQPTDQGLPTGYAATLFAGWDNDHTPLTHIRVSVESVVIHNPLQPNPPSVPRVCASTRTTCITAADCAPDDSCYGVGPVKRWRLQAAVNGEWRELSALDDIDAGEVIPQSITFDQYLPSDAVLQIVANGDSEDCINSIFGQGLKVSVEQLGFTDGLTCLLSSPHNPGEVNVVYDDANFGSGPGVAQYESRSSGGEGGTCSDNGALCLSSSECAEGASCNLSGGAFSLRYRIERLNR